MRAPARHLGIDGRRSDHQLNNGFATFCDQIKEDPLAKKRTEVVVITFGGVARVEIPFTEGRDLQPRTFVAGGGTPMGAAVDLAMSESAAQKQAYKAAGLEYYRPWLFLISHGRADRRRRLHASLGSPAGAGGGQGCLGVLGRRRRADIT